MVRGSSTTENGEALSSESRRRGKGWTHNERTLPHEACAKITFDSAVGDQKKAELFTEKDCGRFRQALSLPAARMGWVPRQGQGDFVLARQALEKNPRENNPQRVHRLPKMR